MVIVYPHYQYYVDPDAIGYISVAKRYAAADYEKAINGYWSPWSCWLTAILIKQGMEAFKAGIVINTLGAAGFLTASYFLFKKFLQDYFSIGILTTTVAFFLVYAVFKQSFADLWSFFFLLLALLVLLKEEFLVKPFWWLLLGVIGAMAYFVKAYAFPYFILTILVVTPVMMKRQERVFNLRKTVIIMAVVLATMLVLSFPWLYVLHAKYGNWITSTAGSLNLSWYLAGHPFYKEGIKLLIPPVYSDAVYFWEDPFWANGFTPHFWTSAKYFAIQIVRVGYNLIKLFNSSNEISCFFLPAFIVIVLSLVAEKIKSFFPARFYIVAIAFVLFPLGYMLINFEARYLWYLLPMSMLVIGLGLEKIKPFIVPKVYATVFIFCAFSYIAFPLWDMKALWNVGKDEQQLGVQLKAAHIQGSFASNIAYSKEFQRIARVAYFSNNPFYYMPLLPTSSQELLQEMRRYHVHYYYHFAPPFENYQYQFTDENGKLFPVVFEDSTIMGLKVFDIQGQ